MDFNATVDLIIKDLNELGDIIDDFKNYPGIPAIQVEIAKAKCRSAAEVFALFKNIDQPASAEKKNEPVLKADESKIIDTSILNPRPGPEVNKETPPPASKKQTESAIFADTFSNVPGSLNERLGNLRDDDVPGMMKNKPVTSLSDAIGVNDKFLFIREIFNGNPQTFDQAILRLDKAENLSDASTILSGYTGGNKDTEAARQLFDLVKRKFPSDE